MLQLQLTEKSPREWERETRQRNVKVHIRQRATGSFGIRCQANRTRTVHSSRCFWWSSVLSFTQYFSQFCASSLRVPFARWLAWAHYQRVAACFLKRMSVVFAKNTLRMGRKKQTHNGNQHCTKGGQQQQHGGGSRGEGRRNRQADWPRKQQYTTK